MSMNEQMNHAEENILHTYNRFPVMFDHGEGCYLYDTEGKKYLDFAAGIAVNSLGYLRLQLPHLQKESLLLLLRCS